MCLYKNKSGGNHHISNKLMLIWSWGQSSQMPAVFYLFICKYIYIFSFLIGGSSVEQSILVQSLLFSEVIKQHIDLLAGDSYLLPSPAPLFHSSVRSAGGKVWSLQKLKAFALQ